MFCGHADVEKGLIWMRLRLGMVLLLNSSTQSVFNLYLFPCLCRYTGGSGGMECVVVLCLLSGEW